MITLYRGSGAAGFSLEVPVLSSEELRTLKKNVCLLLRKRNHEMAAKFWEKYEFEIFEGSNYFGDEFCVLYYEATLDEYISFEDYKNNPKYNAAFGLLADTIAEIGPFIRFVAVELKKKEGPEPVSKPVPNITSASVELALADAEYLLHSSSAVSAVDRVHTAIHAYLRAVCENEGIEIEKDQSLTRTFKDIRVSHPAFQGNFDYSKQLSRIFRSLASILDSLNTLRNRASLAHPNEILLEESEAMLAINCARSILHYIDAKVKSD